MSARLLGSGRLLAIGADCTGLWVIVLAGSRSGVVVACYWRAMCQAAIQPVRADPVLRPLTQLDAVQIAQGGAPVSFRPAMSSRVASAPIRSISRLSADNAVARCLLFHSGGGHFGVSWCDRRHPVSRVFQMGMLEFSLACGAFYFSCAGYLGRCASM